MLELRVENRYTDNCMLVMMGEVVSELGACGGARILEVLGWVGVGWDWWRR